jgi:hypothetical protein
MQSIAPSFKGVEIRDLIPPENNPFERICKSAKALNIDEF